MAQLCDFLETAAASPLRRFTRAGDDVDAVIDVPWQRERLPEAADDFFISPASIAGEVHHLAHQPRDAWSFLAEVRPFHEPW